MIKGFIFDLDGVITDTAKLHYLAWKKIVAQLGINFLEEENKN
ncbi:HAD hydrolase-like protein [Mycoplasmoides gallisepticum]